MSENELTNFSNSPLRYPGGKGKITKFVGRVIDENGLHSTYLEPFAGGAGIAINLLLANKVDNIVINDLDSSVYSFWKTIVKRPDDLIEMINNVPFDYNDHAERLSVSEKYKYWVNVRNKLSFYRHSDDEHNIEEAFYFFMANRINISGIINGGPIGGKKQDGQYNISSRFNKKNLIKKIMNISELSDRIDVKNLEATEFVKLFENKQISNVSDSLMFVDPPYYNQGQALYSSFMTDTLHKRIAKQLQTDDDFHWILTYDTAPQINSLYTNKNVVKNLYKIQYSANKRGKYDEFLFHSSNISVKSYSNVQLREI